MSPRRRNKNALLENLRFISDHLPLGQGLHFVWGSLYFMISAWWAAIKWIKHSPTIGIIQMLLFPFLRDLLKVALVWLCFAFPAVRGGVAYGNQSLSLTRGIRACCVHWPKGGTVPELKPPADHTSHPFTEPLTSLMKPKLDVQTNCFSQHPKAV